MTRNKVENWGYTFIVLGGIIFSLGVINLFFLVEFPNSVDISIKEEG
jgi:predicted membrane channel-forming protein YqfA (hemolysin III family)